MFSVTVNLFFRYQFPVPPQGVVCEFEATIDGKTIIGHVEENEKAQNQYDDALASGRGACMDIFVPHMSCEKHYSM